VRISVQRVVRPGLIEDHYPRRAFWGGSRSQV
jgi:hypothetical protein